jgi:hypothetical protein
MIISRLFSLLVVIAYVAIALIAGAGWEVLKLAAYLVLPLACIWFSDEMGSYSGMLLQGGPMARTPGFLVVAGGWLLLLMPVIVIAMTR